MHLLRPDELRFLHEDVLRQVDVDGPGRPVEAMWNASRMIGPRSLPSFTRKLCFVHEPGDPDVVRLLEGVVADEVRGHLPGEGDDRDGVHHRVLQRGHQIRGGGPEVTRHTPTRPVVRA